MRGGSTACSAGRCAFRFVAANRMLLLSSGGGGDDDDRTSVFPVFVSAAAPVRFWSSASSAPAGLSAHPLGVIPVTIRSNRWRFEREVTHTPGHQPTPSAARIRTRGHLAFQAARREPPRRSHRRRSWRAQSVTYRAKCRGCRGRRSPCMRAPFRTRVRQCDGCQNRLIICPE